MNVFYFFGIIISLLISVVAYFVKQLHRDFKRVEKDVAEVKTTTSIIKTEVKSVNDLMNLRIGFIEKRLNILESFIFKIKDHDK